MGLSDRPQGARPQPHLQGLQGLARLREASDAQEERGYPQARTAAGRARETASVSGATSPPDTAPSSASTRTPSPGVSRPGSGRFSDGQVAPPIRWKWQPSDRERRLRDRGEGAGHLKGRRANLAKIREIQGLADGRE
ncbi:unnamed protein product [Effrenium voratum]|uniref:Uncharacterized protein n=1 Tax=Effrenium voratum TaxID=2562239 RepID=A0AA36ISZ2_9DINO|nr:unnamed protein product [Effrenium voratum]CAJ1447895.1 unnamed protein product [Effrenium voratum]